jgi:hypothetical protein
VADSVIIPAVTGLLGVGVGAGLTQLRWARDRADARRAPYGAKRRDAYDGLWRIVEQAHAAARTESSISKMELLASVNTFAMVNGAYLDDADRHLAHSYIEGVLAFLDELKDADRPEYRDLIPSTAAYPPDFGPRLSRLAEAARQNETMRLELRGRVQRVMGNDAAPNEGDL